MSASPVDPSQGVDAAGFDWQGAVTSALMGGAAMLARLLTMERASWGFIVRSVVAAGIAAYFAGEATRDLFSPNQQGLWMATIGVAGYASPELLSYVLRIVKARGEKIASQEESKARGKKKHRRSRG